MAQDLRPFGTAEHLQGGVDVTHRLLVTGQQSQRPRATDPRPGYLDSDAGLGRQLDGATEVPKRFVDVQQGSCRQTIVRNETTVAYALY